MYPEKPKHQEDTPPAASHDEESGAAPTTFSDNTNPPELGPADAAYAEYLARLQDAWETLRETSEAHRRAYEENARDAAKETATMAAEERLRLAHERYEEYLKALRDLISEDGAWRTAQRDEFSRYIKALCRYFAEGGPNTPDELARAGLLMMHAAGYARASQLDWTVQGNPWLSPQVTVIGQLC